MTQIRYNLTFAVSNLQ